MRSVGGLKLTYTHIQKPMNQALKEETKHAKNLRAKIILQETMCGSSFADLEALLELYPTAVIEFSTYGINVGEIPGRNTVIWEVRDF